MCSIPVCSEMSISHHQNQDLTKADSKKSENTTDIENRLASNVQDSCTKSDDITAESASTISNFLEEPSSIDQDLYLTEEILGRLGTVLGRYSLWSFYWLMRNLYPDVDRNAPVRKWSRTGIVFSTPISLRDTAEKPTEFKAFFVWHSSEYKHQKQAETIDSGKTF